MGRPRKPTAMLEASGAFLRHPERRRARASEPKPRRPLGAPPDRLPETVRAIWEELAEKLAPGVAMESDELMFEVLVVLAHKFRASKASAMDVRLLAQISGKFGMVPSERSKVSAADVVDDDVTSGLEAFRAMEAANKKGSKIN
jgi:hypothetical protein